MNRTKFIYLIHVFPLTRLFGNTYVYPPEGVFHSTRHLQFIQRKIEGTEMVVECCHADKEPSRRVGMGTFYAQFGYSSVEVSEFSNFDVICRYVKKNDVLIVACEKDQLSFLTKQICDKCKITPPDIEYFPVGGMLEINIEAKTTEIYTGAV